MKLHLCAATAIALSLSGSVAGNGQVIEIKVDLESFAQFQQDWLWAQVEQYAKFEAFLRACGRITNFEQRVAAAARPCVTESSLQAVRAVFRKKVAANMRFNPPSICHLPQSPNLLAGIGQTMDSAVNDIANACNACLTCRS